MFCRFGQLPQTFAKKFTWSKVCCAKSVVDIITPATNESNLRLRPSLSLHYRFTG
ncbi:hypothetical protein LOK49_LG08G01590 [Camellia lanceoleosa]|uniref:Uncharacterized protein n=1 Tax=Camellia lanceoleosa TaxID=1840588 RepID=A0ACC0GQ05_9ERIC|nr:hypothetical protein LOK49_LG08G01590 [Camellia lanceoleosa]